MFKVSGATVYPSEVEAALRTLDGVHGAFVTNVPGDHGDRVGAVVVCDVGHTADQLRDGRAKDVERVQGADRVDAGGVRRARSRGVRRARSTSVGSETC